MNAVGDTFVYLAVRLVVAVIQSLRLETCQRLSLPVAHLAADVLRIRQSVVHENLRHVFPQLDARQRRLLARRQWQHLILMVVEIAHTQRKIHLTNWRTHVRFHNKQAMVRQLLSGRPTVLVSGHFGSFEVGGQVVGLFGFPTFTVARPLDNPRLDRFLNSFRGSNGQLVLAKRGSADRIDQLLAQGGSLVVLADQAAGPNGYWVNFFGRPASTHKAIALFALAHEAPVIVTYTRRVGRALQLEIGCEAIADPRAGGLETSDMRRLTEWFNGRLEDLVLRDPDQYWWLHRRWKDYRDKLHKFRNRKQAA
ncbi:MAG: lysophospholipid acyltransferase family protein [Planctomycetota bacterium]|nr:lysophospholipid acyltransferase family protein [Planctomycetota bacterium]